MEMSEWTELWQEYYPLVYSFIKRHVHSKRDVEKEMAEDITSEIFLKAIKATAEGTEVTQTRAWLFAIATRHLIDFYRRRARRPDKEELESLVDLPDNSIPPYDLAASAIGCEVVWRCMQQLAGKEGIALAAQAEKYNNKEKAEMLHTTVGAAKMVMHRGREKLKAMLEKEGYER